MNEFCVVIPASKKNVAFNDDLVKKLGGISLIQRAIDKARALVTPDAIRVVTDSEEIRVISERNSIPVHFNRALKLQSQDILTELNFFLAALARQYPALLVLHPYTPLVGPEVIAAAWKKFTTKRCDLLVSVKEEPHRAYKHMPTSLEGLVLNDDRQKLLTEVRAFQFVRSAWLSRRNRPPPKVLPCFVEHDAVEIRSYQDWWICEKLLNRGRIVFRVIGNARVGMGHIYRALTIAHEITDHEIIFVCDHNSGVTAAKLAGFDYRVEIFQEKNVEAGIAALKPYLVINDILNTTRGYVLRLQRRGIRVVNFEDLGSGASCADLTFNELYDDPLIAGDRICWGQRYFFVRDEFESATPHRFRRQVDGLLLSFGGTDPNNFTRSIFDAVAEFCDHAGIKVYVVTGEGYAHKKAFERHLACSDARDVEFTSATGVISSIMERTQIAISSNGRTVYELAHMNIPAIILSQHDREKTHRFACPANGFINVGTYSPRRTEKRIRLELERLVSDHQFRHALFQRIKRFGFRGNKERVVGMILDIKN